MRNIITISFVFNNHWIKSCIYSFNGIIWRINMSTYFSLCCNGAEPYKPKINRKRQTGLFSLMLADIILPATFGIGFIISKQILKLNPLFLYK